MSHSKKTPRKGDPKKTDAKPAEPEVPAWSTPHADPTPYGRKLAERVARTLSPTCSMVIAHRDYCGLGFVVENAKYLYVIVSDGYPVETVKSFDTQKDFIDWLAEQSDDSLHGCDESVWNRGNQRVTRKRLVEFAG